jgi:hypothetical protein
MGKIHLHTFSALVVVLALSTVSFVGVTTLGSVEAQTTGDGASCPSGNTIFINNTAVTASMTIGPGLYKVSLAVSSVLAPNVRSVVFKIDNDNSILGRGVQVNSNPYYEMQWQSQVTPGGQHGIGATILLNSGTCQVPFVPISLANTTGAGLMGVTAAPNFFEGFTNEPRNFVLNATTSAGGTSLNVSPPGIARGHIAG